RQGPEGPGDAVRLPGRPEVKPDPPAQPGGAGGEPGVPAPARVELADEVKQTRRGRLEVRRQLGDLVAEPIQLRDALRGDEDDGRMDVHGGLPWRHTTPDFSSRLGAPRRGDPVTSDGFRGRRGPQPITRTARAAGTASG